MESLFKRLVKLTLIILVSSSCALVWKSDGRECFNGKDIEKLVEGKKYNAALESIDAFLKKNPNDKRALDEKKLVLEDKDKFVAKMNYDIDVLHYINYGNYDKAIEEIDRYLKYYSDDKEAVTRKSIALIKKGNNRQAISILLELLKKYPDYDTAYNNISWAYINLKDYKKASEYSDKGLAIEPNTDEEYNNKANALIGLKDYSGAVKYCKLALDENPESENAMYGLGFCYFENSDYPNCIKMFTKYREKNPDDKKVFDYIYISYLQLKDYDNAALICRNELERDPSNSITLMYMGEIHFYKKEYGKAVEYLNSYTEKLPHMADAYYLKALCYSMLQQKKETFENLSLAIKYNSKYRDIIKNRSEFLFLKDYPGFMDLLKKSGTAM